MSQSVVCCGFVLLLICFRIHTATADGRTGFFIGSSPIHADIVVDGNVTDAFKDISHPFIVPEVNRSFSFYVWTAHVSGFPDEVSYNSTTTSAGTVATVEQSGDGAGVLYAGDGFLEFTVEFKCGESGSELATVQVGVYDELDASYDQMFIYLQKQCERPSFDVWVKSSESLTPIVKADEQVFDFVSPPTVLSDTFLIGLSNSSAVTQHQFGIFVYCWNLLVGVQAFPSYGFISGAGDSAAVQIQINYTCPENEASNDTVMVSLSFGWQSAVELTFTKQCDTINPLSGRAGLFIGSSHGSTDVVFNGQISDLFNDPKNPFIVPEANQSLSLYINLYHVSGYSDELYYNSTAQVSGSAAVVGKSGAFSSWLYAGGGRQKLVVEFICKQNGFEQVILTMDVVDQPKLTRYPQIAIYFKKQCRLPSFDVSVMSAAVSQPNIPLIVNNSKVDPALYNFVSPTTSLSDTFLIGLNDQSAVDVESFAITNLHSNGTLLSMNAIPSAGYINGLGYNAAVKIQIYYNCTANQTSNSTVSWMLGFGWESRLVIQYTKLCDTFPPAPPTPAPVPSEDGNGWSTATIAAFSAIVLVLSFFVVGSLYKYFIQKRRGCDVLPGISCCRKCGALCGVKSNTDGRGDLDDQYVAVHERGGVNI